MEGPKSPDPSTAADASRNGVGNHLRLGCVPQVVEPPASLAVPIHDIRQIWQRTECELIIPAAPGREGTQPLPPRSRTASA
jgi:hypothetical protein